MSIVSLPRTAAGVVCLLLCAVSPALADSQDDSASGRGHRPEPGREHGKVLAQACADMSEGDDCQVDFDEHTLEGTCVTSERTGDLFCRPAMHRPARAVFEACRDKTEGDDCSFEGRDGDVEGKCVKARPPQHPQHGQHKQRDNEQGDDADARGQGRPLVCMPDAG